jgi:hypothetical protein
MTEEKNNEDLVYCKVMCYKRKSNNAKEFRIYYEEKGSRAIEEIVCTLMAICASSFILLLLLVILLKELKILE